MNAMAPPPPYGGYAGAGTGASLSTGELPDGTKATGNAQPGQARYESQPQGSSEAQGEVKPQDPIDRMLARMDVDKDNRISPREARGLLLELFTRLDRNNDGYLDRNELEAALQRYPGLEVK